jgi:hypothetical protein
MNTDAFMCAAVDGGDCQEELRETMVPTANRTLLDLTFSTLHRDEQLLTLRRLP